MVDKYMLRKALILQFDDRIYKPSKIIKVFKVFFKKKYSEKNVSPFPELLS